MMRFERDPAFPFREKWATGMSFRESPYRTEFYRETPEMT
jgi:hypothetical protein